MNSIVDRIRQHSLQQQNQRALCWTDHNGLIKEVLTYQQLTHKIDQVSTYLAKSGLMPGDIIALLFPPGLNFILSFLACLEMGIIPVPLKIPATEKRLTTILPILYDCKPKCILSPNMVAKSKDFPFAWLQYQDNYPLSALSKPKKLPDIAFLQYTSGATGDCKGVMVSHQNLIHNFEMMKRNLNFQADEVIASWLPHYHDMGLIGAYLGTLYFGYTGYYMAPSSFMFNPNGFLQLISNVRATCIQCPNAAYDWMLKQWNHQNIDLSSLRSVMNGAEPVQISTFEKMYETFKEIGLRKEALKAAYGLAESTLFVTQTNTKEWTAHNGRIACGLVPDIDIRIIDPNTQKECTLGSEGEIWLHSESNTLGYYNKPKLTQEIFQAKVKDNSFDKAYLRTGDLGYIQDNQLIITGRLKDIIIINGVNLYPQDIEHVVEQYPGVLPHTSVAFGWEQGNDIKIVILVEVNKHHVPDINDLISYVLKHLSIPLFDLVLCTKRSLPKTTSGKLKHQLCKQLYKENNLSIVKQMEKGWGIVEFIKDNYQNCDATFHEVGFDSLTMADVQCKLEKIIPTKIKNEFSIAQLYQMQLSEFLNIIDNQNPLDVEQSMMAWRNRVNQMSIARMEQIKNDAELAIKVQDVSKLKPPCHKSLIKHILLTGSTGFIGAYLLLNLLMKSKFHIHLLVRAEDIDSAYDRLVNNLKKYKLFEEASRYHLKNRITLYCGDLSKEKLGLNAPEWDTLSELIDSIFHDGAVTSYESSYEDLKDVNVEGTRAIINLAASKKAKYIHYMSTTFIFGWTFTNYLYENNDNNACQNLDFGYSQSKWAAEQLIWQAEKIGIPIQIYRPSFVTASSEAQYVEEDIIVRALTYMINHQMMVNIPNQISLMPVNKLAADIVAMSLMNAPKHKAYHLTCEYLNFPMVAKYLTEKYGYQFTYVSLRDFEQHLKNHAKPKDPIYPLVPFYRMHYHKIGKMSNKRYDRTNYLSTLNELKGFSSKEYTYKESVDFIIAFLQHKKLIPSVSEAHLQLYLKSHRLKERKNLGFFGNKILYLIRRLLFIYKVKS